MSNEPCPICSIELNTEPQTIPVPHVDYKRLFDCPRCGRYSLSSWVIDIGLEDLKSSKRDRQLAVLSYNIRKMQKAQGVPDIDRGLFQSLIEMPLPNVQAQQDNTILWFGENIKMGEVNDIQPNLFQSIMGAENVSGCEFILKHLTLIGEVKP